MSASNVRYGTTRSTDVLHATGGLRAHRVRGGWGIGPLPGDASTVAAGPFNDQHVVPAFRALGATVFGWDEVIDSEPRARVWRPLLGHPVVQDQPADVWGFVANGAHSAKNDEYATLAQCISLSLRASGIRLRDASDEYHRQLCAAIASRQSPGKRFSNVALSNLHLAFHSLLTEMVSARDYLASAAARRVGAPAKVDSLSRLADWASKPAGRSSVSDAFVSDLLAGWDASGSDRWLYDLGEHRNLYVHRLPMGLNEHSRFLCLDERQTAYGRVLLVEMKIDVGNTLPVLVDALHHFSAQHARLCRLAHSAVAYAKYPATVPHFVVSPTNPSANSG